MGASASVDQLQVIYIDVERAVPRTPRGSRDVEHCDRDGLTDVISRAEQDVKAFYDAAWESCAADDLLVATAALQADFSPEEPPRCALREGATVDELEELASVRAEAMHAALEQPVKESGGAYYQGPRKGTLRIKEKAEHDYGGDVARVVDVERATGVYGTANDFNAAISKLRAAARGEELRILRCKDNLRGGTSGYRDVKLNVDVDGFVGELQLTFQSIKEIKDSGAHQVYEVSRVLAASGDDDALARALDGPDLESEQMLTLACADGRSVLDACGSVALLEAALAKALPPGCCVANVYLWQGQARVRLGIDDVAATAALRDEILLGSGFEEKLNEALPKPQRPATDEELSGLGFEQLDAGGGRLLYVHVPTNEEQLERPMVDGFSQLRCDRGAFLECYANSMMRFTKLTRHQREKLGDVRAARYALLLAPAGGGKTFVAIQRALEVLHENRFVLFVSKNSALALFVVKWLVVASRTSARRVADSVRVLVAPFERGPLEIRVEEAGGRQRLAIGGSASAKRYGLAVVDEAHHLAGDVGAREAVRGVSAHRFLFLGDASQATSAMDGAGLVRSIANVPESAEVATVALEEVVRSTKRIVAGAAAFQLEAGRKAATRGHSASDGPPLEARLFDGDDVERYAREVDAAIESVRRQLHGMDLDDRVAVVCPDADFCEELCVALAKRLGRSFEIVDAATASAALPRGRDEREGSPAWLVVDTVDNIDGLERLVVVCAGLDHAISVDDATALETRSRLYRAMTRAQLAVAVVNHRVPGGWLEFLGRLELGGDFDEERAKQDRLETAADDVVASCADKGGDGVREVPDAGGEGVRAVPDEAEGAALEREEDSSAAERPAVGDGGGDVAETVERESPAAAAPKVSQSIWDTSSCVSVDNSAELRFMPFTVVDLSKLAELATLAGHSREVPGVAVFPDGRRVVSGSGDNTVKVRSVAVFPDGRRVVSGSRDKTVKVWSVAVFPDGRRVVSGSNDKTVKVQSVAVFPDGRRVVSGSWDDTVKVWDAATGECVATLAGHSGDVNGVAIFPDGRRVVSGSYDQTVKVNGVAVFPDGRRVVSGSYDKTVKVYGVAIFPDGRRVVSGSHDETVKVWGC
ncbi:hypothetical protein SO694_00111045 [Aureococcus anophagefferens]|uniref:Helicase ATP-binding domain-containing protein n=1 Tax=Aureococcus anophagefferens TaxID=44056 RepID=A0ABR1FX14_AURAN